MKRFKALQIFLAFMMLILSFLITGCGSNGQTGHWLPARTLTSIMVTPVTASVPVSGNQQFTAIATYSDGTSIDVTTSSAWISSNTTNASVNPASGWATGNVASTSSVITATFGGLSGSATLHVNAATSVSFVVIPATASIPVTGTQQYTAIETFSDGTTQDRTLTSTWTASGAHATISNTSPTIGVATGVSVGTSTITATYALSPHSPATAVLTVNTATSMSFTVIPATSSVPVTGTQQFAAIETFSDGATFDRTEDSTWTAADLTGTSVATIGLHTGLATGVNPGTSTITATYAGSPHSPATAVLTVTGSSVEAVLGTAGGGGIGGIGQDRNAAIHRRRHQRQCAAAHLRQAPATAAVRNHARIDRAGVVVARRQVGAAQGHLRAAGVGYGSGDAIEQHLHAADGGRQLAGGRVRRGARRRGRSYARAEDGNQLAWGNRPGGVARGVCDALDRRQRRCRRRWLSDND